MLEAAPTVLVYIVAARIQADRQGPLFRPLSKSRRGFELKHLDRRNVRAIMKKYGRQVGIDIDRLDSLRKTTIANALNNAEPMHQVQELAGH